VLDERLQECLDDGLGHPAQEHRVGQFAQRRVAPILRRDRELGYLRAQWTELAGTLIPGLRDIPAWIPIYRLIWRRYYADTKATPR
jgi:hypothetical protein